MGSGEQVEVEQRQENNHPLDYRFQKDTNEVNILVTKLNAKDFNFQRKGKAKHQNIAIFISLSYLTYKNEKHGYIPEMLQCIRHATRRKGLTKLKRFL